MAPTLLVSPTSSNVGASFGGRVHKIFVIGDINEESYREFSEKLTEIEQLNTKKSYDVLVELNSGGGSALDALAFCSRIRTSSCKINVVVHGFCGSAAVLVLAAGHRRSMAKEAWLMVHEDSLNKFSGNTSEIEKQAKRLRVLEDQWCALLYELTGTSKEIWAELHKKDLYLTPEQCQRYGIVDEII